MTTTYRVPQEIIVALSTDRVEFLDMLLARLDAGETVPDDSVEDLVRFCVDLVRIRLEDGQRIREIEKAIDQLRDLSASVRESFKGLENKFKQVSHLVRNFEEAVRRDH